MVEWIRNLVRGQTWQNVTAGIVGGLTGIVLVAYVLPPVIDRFPPPWQEFYHIALIAIWLLTEIRPWAARRRPWASPFIRWMQLLLFLMGFVYPALRYSLGLI
ncbi:MAG: hypothetical protein ACOY94_16090 [Bacillota bacterium]